jgi:hypothetical protein
MSIFLVPEGRYIIAVGVLVASQRSEDGNLRKRFAPPFLCPTSARPQTVFFFKIILQYTIDNLQFFRLPRPLSPLRPSCPSVSNRPYPTCPTGPKGPIRPTSFGPSGQYILAQGSALGRNIPQQYSSP